MSPMELLVFGGLAVAIAWGVWTRLRPRNDVYLVIDDRRGRDRGGFLRRPRDAKRPRGSYWKPPK